MDSQEKCFMCKKDISSVGKYFTHDNHSMCDKCIRDKVSICICEKMKMESPSMFVLKCPCVQYLDVPDNQESNGEYIPEYHKIDDRILMEFLETYDSNHHIVKACEGCRLNKEEINKEFEKKIRKGTIYCVYKYEKVKIKGSANAYKLVYCGDILNDETIRMCKLLGYDIGSETSI